MAEEARLTRRVIGVLATRLPEAQLGQVADPRRESGRRWPLATLLRTALVGCVAGCKSLAQTEALTQEMSKALRRTLDIPRRVPDTTMRDALVQVEPAEVRKNAQAIRDELLHYLFGLKGTQPTLLAEARRLLENIPVAKADAMSEDVNGPWVITRRVFLSSEMAGYEWAHLQTALRVHSEKRDLAGKLLESEDRYYISSLPRQELTDEQWLLLVRRHWGVENNCHNTWDTVFQEDDHPWIEADPKGMVVVMLLRRLAYNILALFRGVTQRSEERRQTPWRDLVRSFYNAIIAATTEDVAGLRSRQGAAASLA